MNFRIRIRDINWKTFLIKIVFINFSFYYIIVYVNISLQMNM